MRMGLDVLVAAGADIAKVVFFSLCMWVDMTVGELRLGDERRNATVSWPITSTFA